MSIEPNDHITDKPSFLEVCRLGGKNAEVTAHLNFSSLYGSPWVHEGLEAACLGKQYKLATSMMYCFDFPVNPAKYHWKDLVSYAIEKNSTELLKCIISHFFDRLNDKDDVKRQFWRAQYRIHLQTILNHLVQTENVDLSRVIIETDKDLYSLMCGLTLACHAVQPKMVAFFLDHGAPNYQTSVCEVWANENCRPRQDKLTCIKMLMKKGAHLVAEYLRDSFRLAEHERDTEFFTILCETAPYTRLPFSLSALCVCHLYAHGMPMHRFSDGNQLDILAWKQQVKNECLLHIDATKDLVLMIHSFC